MNHHTAKCISCNAIVSLPSLKARAVACDACTRKRAKAIGDAWLDGPADPDQVAEFERNGCVPPVDKWEQRARGLTEEKRANTVSYRLIRHAELPSSAIAWYLPAGNVMELHVPDDCDVNVCGAQAAPSAHARYWTVSGPGSVWLTKREEKPAKQSERPDIRATSVTWDIRDGMWTFTYADGLVLGVNTPAMKGLLVRVSSVSEWAPSTEQARLGAANLHRADSGLGIRVDGTVKPAKRPFAVGDRVVVKRVPFGHEYAFPSTRLATVEESHNDAEGHVYVQMERGGSLSGARSYMYGRGEGFVAYADDLEHA